LHERVELHQVRPNVVARVETVDIVSDLNLVRRRLLRFTFECGFILFQLLLVLARLELTIDSENVLDRR